MPKSITNPAELQKALSSLSTGQREAISNFSMLESNFRTLEAIYGLADVHIRGTIVPNHEVSADACWEGIHLWLKARAEMRDALYNER